MKISRPDMVHSGPDHYAYLSISGDGHLRDLVATLGLDPDEGWDKDDMRPRGPRKPYGRSGWRLFSGLRRGTAINDHVDRVFERIAPFETAFKTLGSEWRAWLAVTGHFKNPQDQIGISALNHRRAILWGFDWDIDVYFDGMHTL